MTTQTYQTFAAPIRILAPVGAFIATLARAVALSGNAQARFDEIQRLQSLSDADLAGRGIARDDIVRHVYADLMGA
jgi:hypothetical protein